MVEPRVRDKTKLREYSRRHYEKNKPAMIARAKAHTRVVRANVVEFLRAHLEAHPCVDCGETDLIVLEFDHQPGFEKLFNIGEATRDVRSMRAVKAEVAKCEVRCANCHRRKTYKERGYKHRG